MNAKKLHLILAGVWSMLIIPTLVWWHNSILWVAFMSLYANIASHWAAYQASKAEMATKKDSN